MYVYIITYYVLRDHGNTQFCRAKPKVSILPFGFAEQNSSVCYLLLSTALTKAITLTLFTLNK